MSVISFKIISKTNSKFNTFLLGKMGKGLGCMEIQNVQSGWLSKKKASSLKIDKGVRGLSDLE